MDAHEVEFQRFLQKMEFYDNVWKQLVAQKIDDKQAIMDSIRQEYSYLNTIKLARWRPGASTQ